MDLRLRGERARTYRKDGDKRRKKVEGQGKPVVFLLYRWEILECSVTSRLFWWFPCFETVEPSHMMDA